MLVQDVFGYDDDYDYDNAGDAGHSDVLKTMVPALLGTV